jgi:hypothetical protein
MKVEQKTSVLSWYPKETEIVCYFYFGSVQALNSNGIRTLLLSTTWNRTEIEAAEFTFFRGNGDLTAKSMFFFVTLQ